MKREALIHEVATAARERGLQLVLRRHGGEHDIFTCGPVTFAIPRHREVREPLVRRLRRELETALGERWWRR